MAITVPSTVIGTVLSRAKRRRKSTLRIFCFALPPMPWLVRPSPLRPPVFF